MVDNAKACIPQEGKIKLVHKTLIEPQCHGIKQDIKDLSDMCKRATNQLLKTLSFVQS